MDKIAVYKRNFGEGLCLCKEGHNNTIEFISPLEEINDAYLFTEEELKEFIEKFWHYSTSHELECYSNIAKTASNFINNKHHG